MSNGGNEQCTRHMAEFAGMSAACRGDVSYPAESGQDRLKPLEPNFEFDPNHRIQGAVFRLAIGIFCRAALLTSPATGRLICSSQQMDCVLYGQSWWDMREEQSKVPRIKKGQPNSTESDGLFLIRQGQAVSQAADPTLTCRPVSQTGRRLSLVSPHFQRQC